MLKKLIKVTVIIFITVIGLSFVYCVLNYRDDMPVSELKAKYATPESKFININGTDVHYRDEGNLQDKIPVVLLHGNSSNLMAWNGWAWMLKKEYRVIRLDLPGYGLSGNNTADDYSMEYYTAFLHQFLTKLRVTKIKLIGNSMGGRLAWEYALAYPNEVEKLILLDASGYPTNSGMPLPFRLAQIPFFNKILLRVTPRYLIEKSLKEVFADDSKVTDEIVEQYYDMTCGEGHRAAFIARANTPNNTHYLKINEIKTPTLLLWGEKDKWVSIDDAKKFEHDLPNSRLITYKDLGHMPMAENASETVKDALEFFKPRVEIEP